MDVEQAMFPDVSAAGYLAPFEEEKLGPHLDISDNYVNYSPVTMFIYMIYFWKEAKSKTALNGQLSQI